MLIMVVFAVFIVALPALKRNFELMACKGQLYVFSITNTIPVTYDTDQGISLMQAEDIWKQNIEMEEAIPMVFYKILENQMLINQKLGRSFRGTVYDIKGESCLLFPEGVPLEPEDKNGCLISRGLAWELFGDTQVTGALVDCGGRESMVRGVLPSDDMLLVRLLTEKEATLGSLLIKADSYHAKEQYKEQLSQYYGLQLKDNPTIFQRLRITTDMLPNRMSDFSGWVDFLKRQFYE